MHEWEYVDSLDERQRAEYYDLKKMQSDEEAANMRPVSDKCPRCDGHGTIAKYAHVNGGVCLKCKGRGYLVRFVTWSEYVDRMYQEGKE